MLESVLAYLNNWFLREVKQGKFTIKNGNIALPFLLNGQHFKIAGSALNNGLYIYGDTIKDGDGEEAELKDETFNGAIWVLEIERGVIDLANDIKEWQTKYGETINSPYTSESFGGYSYSKPDALSGSSDGAKGWASVFALQLEPYRKMPGMR